MNNAHLTNHDSYALDFSLADASISRTCAIGLRPTESRRVSFRLLHRDASFQTVHVIVNKRRRLGVPLSIRALGPVLVSCFGSFSSRAHSPTSNSRAILLLLPTKAEPTHPGTDHLRPASPASARTHERIEKTHRYRITAKGLRTALFYTRLIIRSRRPHWPSSRPLQPTRYSPWPVSSAPRKTAINKWYEHEKLAA